MRTRLALLVFVLAAIYFLGRTFLPALTTMTHSFPAYYTASRLVVEGRWSVRVYDDEWFEARVLEMTQGRVSDHFSLHPPTTSLLLVPIAWLDLTTARVVWQIFNLALLIAALWLVLDALQILDVFWRLALFGFAFVYPPLAENIRVGQAYILILFLFALALWSGLRGAKLLMGIGLGAAAGIKLSGAPIWFVLAVRRDWRALFWSGVVVALSALLGLLGFGWEAWFAFLQRVMDYSKPVPLAAHVAFQATPDFFQRMFVASAEFNPTPLFDAPAFAPVFNFVLLGAALGALGWFARNAKFEIAFAAAVTAGVIFFPMATEYHYTLLLLPLAVMGARLLETRSRFEAAWFAAILLLLCVPFDWNAPRWNERAWVLFAYPRLYGGGLLFVWCVRAMLPARKSQTAALVPAKQVAQ